MLDDLQAVHESDDPRHGYGQLWDVFRLAERIANACENGTANLRPSRMLGAAADLEQTITLGRALDRLADELPAEHQGIIEASNARYAEAASEAKAAKRKREEFEKVQCNGRVRSEGYGRDARCSSRGSVEVDGKLYCKRHAKQALLALALKAKAKA
jgi:hypothetical protein